MPSGAIVKHAPLRPPPDEKCRLFVTPDIKATLDGGNLHVGFPHPLADRVVAMLVGGYAFRVTRKMGVEAELEQLVDVDEVWVLCFRKPVPGFRLFGRFIERDAFVGLRLCDRRDLRTRALYEAAAQAMIEEWARIFGNIPPLRSTDLDAYLSGNYVDVDDL